MMVKDLNDSLEHLDMIIDFIKKLKPNKAFIAVPTRPPAETWVQPASPNKLIYIYEKLNRFMPNRIELLNYKEEGEFGIRSEDPLDEFVNIVSVHPMRMNDVYKFFEKRGLDPEKILKILLDMGDILIIGYDNSEFVIRKLLTRRICPDKNN
jgi:wyosine [tRNA(Phe)-imidazoG37] synthetase (radical SAM superfamily)